MEKKEKFSSKTDWEIFQYLWSMPFFFLWCNLTNTHELKWNFMTIPHRGQIIPGMIMQQSCISLQLQRSCWLIGNVMWMHVSQQVHKDLTYQWNLYPETVLLRSMILHTIPSWVPGSTLISKKIFFVFLSVVIHTNKL